MAARERVVAHLCDALVELGHEVTLFAAADAHTKARLIMVRDQAIRLEITPDSTNAGREARSRRAALGFRWFALLGALWLYPIRDGFQS